MFKDRNEAGNLLASKLEKYGKTDALILAIPRGGVPLGFIIAQKLNLPLEMVLSKKIGHPLHKEFAIGAVTLKSRMLSVAAADISPSYIDNETERIRMKLSKNYQKYYGDRKPLELKNKILIIVDDGIATGNTMLSIIKMLHDENPEKIVVAIPVAPPDAIKKLQDSIFIDEVVCLLIPDYFKAVGQFYQHFNQVDDELVKHLLEINKNKLLY
jgi:predicted phosphoribosyltransferase